jgi:hypothetical protein
MKKGYLFLIIFLSVQVRGQFFEGFENGVSPPAGWVIADNGVGIGNSWRDNIPVWPAYEGTRCAFIDREWIGIGNTSEDLLITPAITVGTNASLNFTSTQTITGDVGTLYQIRISTSSQTDQSSFTLLASYTEQTINSGIDYETKYISLNDFNGQTVYIAFVRIFTQPTLATLGDRWLLDNVTVSGVLSSSDFNSKNELKIASNPVDAFVNLSIPSGIMIQSIAIYNPLGQLVKTLTADEISSSLAIDVTALKTGTYLMEINSNQGKTTKKFIKL